MPFAKKIDKSKEILRVHKDVDILKDQIEVLQKEREENLKLHEATIKSYQESSKKEINDLKSEISTKDHMLEDWEVQHHRDEEAIEELRAQLASFTDERKFVDSDILSKFHFSHASRNEYSLVSILTLCIFQPP